MKHVLNFHLFFYLEASNALYYFFLYIFPGHAKNQSTVFFSINSVRAYQTCDAGDMHLPRGGRKRIFPSIQMRDEISTMNLHRQRH